MGYIYLLMTNLGHEELYKIGVTKSNVQSRIKQLQTGNASKIQLLHVYESPHYMKIEKWLHARFNLLQTESKNEWFRLSNQDITDFLKTCQKGEETIVFMKKNNPFFR